MFRWEKFKSELDKDNGHYERFKKSELHDLVELLKRKMPSPTPAQVAAEMKKISAKKWVKYSRTKAYLEKVFPQIRNLASAAGVGLSVPGYLPGKWERTKDVDGRWHQYMLQKKGNSCGPACVTMLKTSLHPGAGSRLREPEVRGIVALYESGKQHSGVSALSAEAVGAHDWVNVGSDPAPLVKTLQSEPYAIRTAKGIHGSPTYVRSQLEKCSSKKPAIVGWWWDGNASGGHWTVCVGPTKDKTKLRILDPWNGIQYVNNSDDDFSKYAVHENGAVTATGWFNPNDPNDVAVIICG